MFKKITDARWSLMRMTFIQADYCYVCEKPNLTTKEVQIDNIMGRNRHGWICCDNCEKYVRVAKIMEEMFALQCLDFDTTFLLSYMDFVLDFSWSFSKKNGIKVNVGSCKIEAIKINKDFVTKHEKKRPYIIIKQAVSLESKI